MNSRVSRRAFLRLSAGASLGIALAACAPVATPQTTTDDAGAGGAASDSPMELDFWHPFGGAREELMQTLIDGFQAENPSITVEGLTGQPQEKFIAAVAAGTPPDVIMFRSDHQGGFVDEGVFVALDDFISGAGVNADELFYKAEIDSRRFNGETYGLPTVTAAGQNLAFYNVARFEEAGLDPDEPLTTWADWEAALPNFVDADSEPKKLFATLDQNGNTFYLYFVWLYLNGGKYISDDLTQIAFGDEVGVQAMQWLYDMMSAQADYSEIRPTGGDEYVTASRTMFATGQTAISVWGPWMFVQFPTEYEMQLEDFRVHPLPYHAANPDTGLGVPTPGGWANCLPAGVPSPEASFEFIRYSTTTPASLEFTLAQARPNPVKEYNADERYYDVSPYWETMIQIFEQDFAIPTTASWTEIDQLLRSTQEEVLYGKVSPEEGILAAAEEAQRILDKEG